MPKSPANTIDSAPTEVVIDWRKIELGFPEFDPQKYGDDGRAVEPVNVEASILTAGIVNYRLENLLDDNNNSTPRKQREYEAMGLLARYFVAGLFGKETVNGVNVRIVESDGKESQREHSLRISERLSELIRSRPVNVQASEALLLNPNSRSNTYDEFIPLPGIDQVGSRYDELIAMFPEIDGDQFRACMNVLADLINGYLLVFIEDTDGPFFINTMVEGVQIPTHPVLIHEPEGGKLEYFIVGGVTAVEVGVLIMGAVIQYRNQVWAQAAKYRRDKGIAEAQKNAIALVRETSGLAKDLFGTARRKIGI